MANFSKPEIPANASRGRTPPTPNMSSPTGSFDSGVGGLNTGTSSDFTMVIDGNVICASALEKMARELEQARARGDFPDTIAPGYDTRAIIKDHAMLMRLKIIAGDVPRSEWTQHQNIARLYVEIARFIRERDGVAVDQLEAAATQARIVTIQDRVNRDAEVYDVVNHALRVNAGPDGTMRDMVRNEIRAAVCGSAVNGVTNANADAITNTVVASLDKIPGGLSAVLGCLTDNNNLLVDHNDRMTDNNDRHANNNATVERQIRVIGQHVNAIEGNTNAMGQNVNSLSNLINAINTHLSATGNQVDSLQSLIRMLPEIITNVLQQTYAQAIEQALHRADMEQRRQQPKQGVFSRLGNLFKRETQRSGVAI